ARLAETDGTMKSLETRRDEASARAQAARDALLQSSRAAGELEAQWARLEQTMKELVTGIAARESESTQHQGAISGLEAEVSGLSSGLTGLLDSEGSQRDRVVELQKRFQALKEEGQAFDD